MTNNGGAYRDPAENGGSSEPPPPSIEDGLRRVLDVLTPYDADDCVRIVLAVSALYDLGLREGMDEIEDDDDEEST